MRARFPWGLTIACGLAFAVLVSLGVWQMQRLHWKQGLIAEADAAATMPAAPLSEVLASRYPEFRRVVLQCNGLDDLDVVEVVAIDEGEPGTRLVSACPLPSGGPYDSIFVDRGFVADGAIRRLRGEGPDVNQVSGVLRALPASNPIQSWVSDESIGGPMTWRDPSRLSQSLGVSRPAPFTVYATTSSNPEWRALRPSAPPAAFSNNHLGYALTWFGLALALVGFYIALLRRRSRS